MCRDSLCMEDAVKHQRYCGLDFDEQKDVGATVAGQG